MLISQGALSSQYLSMGRVCGALTLETLELSYFHKLPKENLQQLLYRAIIKDKIQFKLKE